MEELNQRFTEILDNNNQLEEKLDISKEKTQKLIADFEAEKKQMIFKFDKQLTEKDDQMQELETEIKEMYKLK